jgi:hypothetical protein
LDHKEEETLGRFPSFIDNMYFSFPTNTLLIVLALVTLVTSQDDETPQVVATRLINERMGVDQGYNLNLRHPERFGKYCLV